LVDIVTLNRETGEFKAYDVKSRNYRKSNYIAKDGCYRKTKGRLILRPRTKEQKKLGVEIIYPKERDDKWKCIWRKQLLRKRTKRQNQKQRKRVSNAI